jgi:hypothetical protein
MDWNIWHRYRGRCAVAAGLFLLLAACGGSGTQDQPEIRATESDGRLAPACAGTHCAAMSPTTYAGKGVGIWHYSNSSDLPTALPIAIGGINDRSLVNLIFANESPAMQDLAMGQKDVPPLTTVASMMPPHGANAMLQHVLPDAHALVPPSEGEGGVPATCPGNETAWPVLVGKEMAPSGTGPMKSMAHCTTLMKEAWARDGRAVKIWVETAEIGDTKINPAFIDMVSRRFVEDSINVYDMVTEVAGKPWGPHGWTEMIAGDSAEAKQPLHIVFLNLSADSSGYSDVLGLFPALNTIRNFNLDGRQISGRGLALYVNVANLIKDEWHHIDGDSTRLNPVSMAEVAKSALAHELTHLVNFYNRTMLLGPEFKYEKWLEEFSAMSMQHIVDTNLPPVIDMQTGKPYALDAVGRQFLAAWLQGKGNCSLNMYSTDTVCSSYSVGGSFGLYLLHRYGVGFYRNLQNSRFPSNDSIALLDSVIKSSGGQGFSEDFWRSGVSLALLSSANAPQGFGLPAWADARFTLPAIHGIALQRFPTWATPAASIPNKIRPYGFVSIVRPTSGRIYMDHITVPPRSSLTVLIQQKPDEIM